MHMGAHGSGEVTEVLVIMMSSSYSSKCITSYTTTQLIQVGLSEIPVDNMLPSVHLCFGQLIDWFYNVVLGKEVVI